MKHRVEERYSLNRVCNVKPKRNNYCIITSSRQRITELALRTVDAIVGQMLGQTCGLIVGIVLVLPSDKLLARDSVVLFLPLKRHTVRKQVNYVFCLTQIRKCAYRSSAKGTGDGSAIGTDQTLLVRIGIKSARTLKTKRT